MNQSQAIIDKILGDAKAVADNNTTIAHQKADKIIGEATAKAEAMVNSRQQQLKSEFEEQVARRVTVAGIDAKKIILAAKTNAIDKALMAGRDKLCAMDDKSYLKYIAGLLKKGASDGDVVVISANDSKRITAEFIKEQAIKLKIKLTLGKSHGDFCGGVYLESTIYDKNYTVDSQINELRDDLVAQLAQELFKE